MQCLEVIVRLRHGVQTDQSGGKNFARWTGRCGLRSLNRVLVSHGDVKTLLEWDFFDERCVDLTLTGRIGKQLAANKSRAIPKMSSAEVGQCSEVV